MQIQNFDFSLPQSLIAQYPLAQRSDSRLLYLDGHSGNYCDAQFRQLPNWLNAGDVLVFNDTRVIKARLMGYKASGGRVEVLVERVCSPHSALVHIRASNAPQIGNRLHLAEAFTAVVRGRQDDLFLLDFETDATVMTLLDSYGAVPLPPYILHSSTAIDEARYQTIFARHAGAVAAPTAGLHFDTAMLNTLQAHGIVTCSLTLHVGAGTFQPVREHDIRQHTMHSEWYNIPLATVLAIQQARQTGKRIVAVGTTSLRALESQARDNGELTHGMGETTIFITPGYVFRITDMLLTNFHLPKSTLMMLVCAFASIDKVQKAYAHAITQNYRFFSYGDAMLIKRGDTA